MKTIIAYALLILGLPVLIGGFVSAILIILFKPLRISNNFFEILDGIVAAVIAFYLFVWLDVNISIIVPVILSAVSFVWY